MNGFTFYKNYYEILKNLKDNERLELLDGILMYMFENKNPEFSGLLYGIWVNIKMPLDTSKNASSNGAKGGAPTGNVNAQKQAKNKLKTSQKQANNISYFYFLISNFLFLEDKGLLREKIEEWLKYKWERKEYYKETGFKQLLARIERATSQYGVDAMIELINDCMASNYKGIIFEKMKGKPKKAPAPIPKWFNNKYQKQEVTEEEKQEMEDMLKEFK